MKSAYLRYGKVPVTGVRRPRGKVLGDEVREITRGQIRQGLISHGQDISFFLSIIGGHF